MNLERPVCLNLANLGPLENSSAPPGSHRVVLTRGAAHRYMVRFSPLPRLLAKARRYDSQSGSSMELASVPNQPRNCGTLGDTSSGERIHFLVKPSTFVGIWRRLRIFSCLFFSFFFFTLHPFPLLLHVPGLYTALWSDYSSSGLITVNEGLRTGL